MKSVEIGHKETAQSIKRMKTKIHDILLDILMLWPAWFLLIIVIGMMFSCSGTRVRPSMCNYQTVKLQESGYGMIHDYQKKGIRAQKSW